MITKTDVRMIEGLPDLDEVVVKTPTTIYGIDRGANSVPEASDTPRGVVLFNPNSFRRETSRIRIELDFVFNVDFVLFGDLKFEIRDTAGNSYIAVTIVGPHLQENVRGKVNCSFDFVRRYTETVYPYLDRLVSYGSIEVKVDGSVSYLASGSIQVVDGDVFSGLGLWVTSRSGALPAPPIDQITIEHYDVTQTAVPVN